MTRASTEANASGVVTMPEVARDASSGRECSRISPWSPRTPIFTRERPLPTARRQALLLGDVSDVDPDHRFAEATRHLCDDVGILEVSGGLDDRSSASGGVAGL